MNYKTRAYSFLKLGGRIWESEYAHYRIGMKALARVAKGGRVLDVGCGAGALTSLWQIKRSDLFFTGVDVSKKAIGMARKSGTRARFVEGSAEALPFPKNSFEAVTCCEVIEHLSKPADLFSDVGKVLKKNGVLYLTTQLERDRRTLVGAIWGRRGIKAKEKVAGHIVCFDEKEILGKVRRAGFRIVEVRYNCHWLGQIEDLCYLIYLRRKGGEVLSFTNYLQKKSGWIWRGGILAMRIIAAIRNIETLLLAKQVGLGIQIIAIKK